MHNTLEEELLFVASGWEEMEGGTLMEEIALRGLRWLVGAGYEVFESLGSWKISSPLGEEVSYTCSLPVAIRAYCIHLLSSIPPGGGRGEDYMSTEVMENR